MECVGTIDEDSLAAELGEMSVSNAGEDNESQASTNKRDIPVTEVRGWSVEQVCDWLRSRGLSALEAAFVENDITGAELLRLDTNDRLQLGISQVGVRKRFEEAIELLKQGESHGRDGGETGNSGTSEAGCEEGEEVLEGPVKLFIGQVPREATCDDLKALLEGFGPVVEAVVLRDRYTGEPRGCGFVKLATREAAAAAIAALHNQQSMPPNHSLLQVQYARGENRGGAGAGGEGAMAGPVEHKLFVGQLPKDATEAQLQQLFAAYGELTEVCLLRHPNGNSKACCFVKYVQRESAVRAIQALSGAKILPGAAAPLNIEFAESKRDKWLKRAQRAPPMPLPHMGPSPFPISLFPYMPHMPLHMHHHMPQAQQPALPPMMAPAHGGGPAPNSFRGGAQFPMASMGPPGPFPGGSGMFPGGPPMYPPGMFAGGVPQGMSYACQSPRGTGGMGMGGQGQFNGGEGYGGQGNAMMGGGNGAASGGWYQEGPPGCSVLVYNLHRDLTEWDLMQIFGTFGPLVSMQVVVDRLGRSKGYGVVSFDNTESAAEAVNQMNNSEVMGRKIKVQLKMLK